MKRYRVTGEWLIRATSATEAENLIENAVAKETGADLEDCNAELEDEDDDLIDPFHDRQEV